MALTDRQAVMLAYSALSDFYQTSISDRALELYADDLADLSAQQVVAALRQLRQEPGRRSVPLPSDVRACVGGRDEHLVDDEAGELAGRVVQSIGKFGYMRATEARQWLGEEGWQIVNAKGGWHTLCANTMAGENAFFAQCRDLAKGIMRKQFRIETRQRGELRAAPNDVACRQIGLSKI